VKVSRYTIVERLWRASEVSSASGSGSEGPRATQEETGKAPHTPSGTRDERASQQPPGAELSSPSVTWDLKWTEPVGKIADMTGHTPSTLLALALALAACSAAPACSSEPAGAMDADTVADAATDTASDTAPDAVADAAPDTAADAVTDTATDAATDTAADAAPDTATDAAPDTAPDAAADAAPDTATDTVADAVPDAVADAAPDTAPDTAPDAGADAGPAGPIPAVLGARCAPMERVGLIELGDAWGSRSLSAQLYDAPNPLLSEPAQADAACDFYQYAPGPPCDPACGQGTTCGLDGTCQPEPQAALDAVVTLSAQGDEEVFTADPVTGSVWGSVTLPGDTLAVRVAWLDQEVTLTATTIPGELSDLAGQLQGGYSQPQSLDLTWTPPSEGPADPNGPQVFTDIPINHHAGGPTHTVCAVPDTAGSLHVDGAMLQPLAVITGLEFQGVAHVQFAAAQTPLGCVELRLRTFQYTDLGY